MKTRTDLYSRSQLVMAAIRLHEHRQEAPPTVEEICKALAFSPDHGYRLCQKLSDAGVLKLVEGVFGTRYTIGDHLLAEDLPREETAGGIQDELAKFQESRKTIDSRVQSFKEKQDQSQKDLFAELEKKLKMKKKE